MHSDWGFWRRRAILACLGLTFAPALAARPARADTRQRAQVRAYLFFDGACREAMGFYQSVFGGRLELTTVGDSPMAASFPPPLRQRTLPARLLADEIVLSASDWLTPNEPPSRGNMNALYIESGAPERARELFERLSRGAAVTAPFAEQPFGWYGRLVDAYGVIWMFHAA